MVRILDLEQPQPDAAPELALRVCAEQTRTLYRLIPLALAASAGCVWLVSMMLAHELTASALRLWLTAAYVSGLPPALLWAAFVWRRPAEADMPRWREGMALAVLPNSAILGSAALWLPTPAHFGQEPAALWLLLSITLAGLLLAQGSARAFTAFAGPALSLTALAFVAGGGPGGILTGLGALAALPVLCALTRRWERGQLRARKRAVEELRQARSRFIATVSHELRQPLHALDLLVKALLQQPLGGEALALGENVLGGVRALDELLDGLMKLARLDSGAVKAQVKAFPLQALFEHLRQELDVLAQEKKLRWVIRSTRVSVKSDPSLLLQILRNFAGNAIRYTPAGQRVLIAARRDGAAVRIEVRDSGCGIAPEDQERVFQEFVQLNGQEGKGTGLGLAITARLAALLSHPLSVRSAPERGAVFAVSVPRADPRTDPIAPSPSPVPGAPPGLQVLVLEGDLAQRLSLKERLSAWGYPVAVADCAQEALSQLAGCAPDVVLTDEHLIGEAAQVSAQCLKQQEGRAGPQVWVMAQDLAGCRACEARGFPALVKPVQPARLRTLLLQMRSQPLLRAGADAPAGHEVCP